MALNEPTVDMIKVSSISADNQALSTPSPEATPEPVTDSPATNSIDTPNNDEDTKKNMNEITTELQSAQSEANIKWNQIFHIFLLSACIIGPSLMIITFIAVTYTNGRTLSCCSISAGIQYTPSNPSTYYLTIFLTIIAVILAFFVSVCRQIQITVKFQEYIEKYEEEKRILRRYWVLNNYCVFFNITGYLSIILFVILDSSRYSLHVIFSTYAFAATLIFLCFTAVITFKERRIEYEEKLIVFQANYVEAAKNTFFMDGIIMFTLFVFGLVLVLVYMIEYLKLGTGASTTKRQVSDAGNVAEWTSFFCVVSGLMALAMSFHHDNVDDELMKFWKLFFQKKENRAVSIKTSMRNVMQLKDMENEQDAMNQNENGNVNENENMNMNENEDMNMNENEDMNMNENENENVNQNENENENEQNNDSQVFAD